MNHFVSVADSTFTTTVGDEAGALGASGALGAAGGAEYVKGFGAGLAAGVGDTPVMEDRSIFHPNTDPVTRARRVKPWAATRRRM